jgi:type II secretory pathway component GspD/PulD (secretin)
MQTLNSKLERFDRQTNLLLSGVSVQDASNEGEISKEVMNKGIADSNLCAGQEVVTEKLFVYFESPTVVCQFLKGYFTPAQPMLGSFPINGQLQGQVNGSMVNSYNSNINASAAYTANQGVSGMNNFASATNGLGSLGTNSSSAANQTQSSNLSKSSQGTAGQQNQGCTLNIDPDASVSESGVLTIGKNASTKSIGNETDSKNNNSAVETERKVAAEKSTSSKHNSKARDSSQTLEVTQVCEGKKPRFKLATDPTGVIVSGPPGYVDLAVRLARDVDIPTIEVLAEVYLVEVQKNWAQTIETQFARGVLGGYPQSSVGMVSQILNTANLVQGSVTGGYQGTFAANGGDILAFINLLESNSVGRSISSPTLIAKNGQDAVLEKTLTLRKSITNTAAPYSSNGTTIAGAVTTQVESLDVPFKITLTPVINQHNRHVSTSFEYTETVLYPPVTTNPLENSTMLNHVRTVLETAPGEVVVLAGLFKENNNIATTSMPGMSALGVLAPLLGGSNDKTSQSTELLVFIKPTVIEPREVLGRH